MDHDNSEINIKKGNKKDAQDFSELMLMSAPYFPLLFGNKIKKVLENLFCISSNLFSFEHTYFATINGINAGMILGYDWKTKNRENVKTGLLLFKHLRTAMLSKLSTFIKFNSSVGKLNNYEYYISNLATYPEYRKKGIGKRLLLESENEAKRKGAKRLVLDVEKENIIAINFYERSGYKKVKNFSINITTHKIVNLFRMTKEIE